MSATTTPTDSPVIHPMHNPAQAAVVQQPLAPVGNTSHLLNAPGQGTKAMLAKRMAGKGSNPKYISPTDKMMTPCTAKINQSKKKHFNKAKPVQFFMAAHRTPEEPSEEATPTSDEEDVDRPQSEDQADHDSSSPMVVDDENPF